LPLKIGETGFLLLTYFSNQSDLIQWNSWMQRYAKTSSWVGNPDQNGINLAASKNLSTSRSEFSACAALSSPVLTRLKTQKLQLVKSKIPVQQSCGIHSCAQKADQPWPINGQSSSLNGTHQCLCARIIPKGNYEKSFLNQ